MTMNRLQEHYQKQVLPQLKKELNIDNDFAVPRLEKIVVNMGIGDVSKDKQARDKIFDYIGKLTGQKPQIRSAKKAIANFGIRIGDPVGVRVTLRGERAYAFLDRLNSIVLPRVRDFQGIKLSAFDEAGNYNLGLAEQIIFPEVEYDTIDRVRGLQITITTTAKNKEESYVLLKALGMPFEKQEK